MNRTTPASSGPAGSRAARAATGSLAALGVVAGGLFVTQSAWGSAVALARLPHAATVDVTQRGTSPDQVGGQGGEARCRVHVLRRQGASGWGWESCRGTGAASNQTWSSAVRIQDGHLWPVPVEALPWDLRALVRHCPSAVVPEPPHALAGHGVLALAAAPGEDHPTGRRA